MEREGQTKDRAGKLARTEELSSAEALTSVAELSRVWFLALHQAKWSTEAGKHESTQVIVEIREDTLGLLRLLGFSKRLLSRNYVLGPEGTRKTKSQP